MPADTSTTNEHSLTFTGVAIYTAMVAVAALAGWWWSIDLWQPAGEENPRSIHDFVRAAALGLLATVPLVILLLSFDRRTPPLLKRLKKVVDDDIVPMLRGLSIAEFAILSLCAGVGEELLFRGLIQNGLAWLFMDWHMAKPLILAAILAAIAFGLCHWLNWEYALVAGIIGLYFGWLFLITKSLVAPMVAHAAYDFIALCFLVRYKK